MFTVILEILVLVTAVSVDAFTAGFAYGVSGVRVPWRSIFVVAGVSSLTLCAALLVGNAAGSWIPAGMADRVSFLILFLLGLWKLTDQARHQEDQRADRNRDKVLSPGEALTLGLALSVDSVAAGVGAGVIAFPVWETLAASFVMGILAVWGGWKIGRTVSRKIHSNLYWISGVLLLVLAFGKLVK
ncbi:MAG: manganese efflux pump [Eubacteriales bacterium]|nr:manganese efflux pump [Eubacteriales bacterium]